MADVDLTRTWDRNLNYAYVFFLSLAATLSVLTNSLLGFVLALLSILLAFLPSIMEKRRTWAPLGVYNALIVALIYSLILLGGLFHELGVGEAWSVISQTITGGIMGGIGFLLICMLSREKPTALRISPTLVMLFSFALGLAIGAIWEIVQYSIDNIIGLNMQGGLDETMLDLIGSAVGALIVSVYGYHYLRVPRRSILHKVAERVLESGNKIIGSPIDDAQVVREQIYLGEGKEREYKSSLRTNMRTGEQDKRMEHAVLKTLAAFLNSDGGILLIGVQDDGKIIGIDVKGFDNQDKYYLHLTNLIGEEIGREFLPFVDTRLVAIDGQNVMMVCCSRSKVPVFLKAGTKEEFYVRSGASSSELLGREMVDYISIRFGK